MSVHQNQVHAFHLVDPSPWPLLSAVSALSLTFGGVLYMHGFLGGAFLYKYGLFLILCLMFVWWRDIIREATFEGQHTKKVQTGLKIGMLLFITSELMFFFAFFWAFFHASLNPGIALGAVWPPAFLSILDPWSIPLLNTIILLSSGATVTYAHHAIVAGEKEEALFGLSATILLAIFFTFLQGLEYINSPFSIYTSVYGSTFFY